MLPVLAGCGGAGTGDGAAPATRVAQSTPTPTSTPTSTSLALAPSTTRPAPAPATTVALGPEWTQQDGFVLIEAVAAGDPATLLRDLQALGLRDGVAVGRVVNGWLPVASFDRAQRLASLQFVRPTGAGTG